MTKMVILGKTNQLNPFCNTSKGMSSSSRESNLIISSHTGEGNLRQLIWRLVHRLPFPFKFRQTKGRGSTWNMQIKLSLIPLCYFFVVGQRPSGFLGMSCIENAEKLHVSDITTYLYSSFSLFNLNVLWILRNRHNLCFKRYCSNLLENMISFFIFIDQKRNCCLLRESRQTATRLLISMQCLQKQTQYIMLQRQC